MSERGGMNGGGLLVDCARRRCAVPAAAGVLPKFESSLYVLPAPGIDEYGFLSRSIETDGDSSSSSEAKGRVSGFDAYGLLSRSRLGELVVYCVLGGGGGKLGALRRGPTPSAESEAAQRC